MSTADTSEGKRQYNSEYPIFSANNARKEESFWVDKKERNILEPPHNSNIGKM